MSEENWMQNQSHFTKLKAMYEPLTKERHRDQELMPMYVWSVNTKWDQRWQWNFCILLCLSPDAHSIFRCLLGHVWTSSTKRYQNQEQSWHQHQKNGNGNTLCLNHDTLITLYLLMLTCGILPPHEWRKLDAKPQPLHTTNGQVWTSSTKRHQDQEQLWQKHHKNGNGNCSKLYV